MKRLVLTSALVAGAFGAGAYAKGGDEAAPSHTVEQARFALGVPEAYGLSAEQQKLFNPIVRQCGSDLSSMRGFRKGDEWYDWAPVKDESRRNEMRAYCAAYQVGIVDGIGIGDRAAKR
ncbi:hypothetical protein L7H23_01100 [Sphingopyxis sp. BSN-002]|uniref:hypothetical protein n=1 Tax=Sphingopyxis sp. BSN-002 TaxID=2911495 RepID=UPI001EDA39F0|nr:hypothetical protein [Sphingopyxis sp. BSN-002]UKK84730.1 hypothetical protein L7H23_01100 [Sphingopyxis sp. BSN-002]